MRVPWTARLNQSILKEIDPEYSLEGLMLKLKLQYYGHLMQRANSLEKTLMLGKIEGKRRRRQQKMRWLDGITDSMGMSLTNSGRYKGQGSLACCSSQGRKEKNMTYGLNNNNNKPSPEICVQMTPRAPVFLNLLEILHHCLGGE